MTAASPSVAVITGAASGIGQALAVRLAESGTRIVAGYHPGDPYDPEETVGAVKQAGGECIAHAVDVRHADQVDDAVCCAVDRWGRVDVAVANAGVLRKKAISEMTDDAWQSVLDVDLTGVVRLFRAAAPHMTAGGAMIAVSSVAGGVFGWAEHAHYAAAKAGIIGLSKSLAVELGPRGVRVNAVIPGTIDTPQAQDGVNSLGSEGIAQQALRLPLRRPGRASDVASAIAFLASDEASFITGTTLLVDGGMSAALPS